MTMEKLFYSKVGTDVVLAIFAAKNANLGIVRLTVKESNRR